LRNFHCAPAIKWFDIEPMSRSPAPHPTDLPFLIVALSLGFQALIKRLRSEAGLREEVAIGMGSIFFALCENGGCVMRDLASRLRMPKGTLSGLVARMEQMGLVDRRQCPDDGRAQRVRLTRKARALEANLRARHSHAMAILQTGLTEGEVAQLTGLLKRVLENLRANESAARTGQASVLGAKKPARVAASTPAR
jgi:DNA-binding MarR family transcriptional regulator